MTFVIRLMETRNQQQLRPVLVVEDTKGKKLINLDKNIYSLGRDSKKSIVIHSQLVSRHHATLLRVTNPDNNAILFQIIDGDLQGNPSTNGLIINGKRCSLKTLNHNDSIVFGSKAQATYIVVTSDLSESEILELWETDNFSEYSTASLDPEETIFTSSRYVQPLSEAALLRLASFPELLPSPIVEIDPDGNITYLNPAALLTFSNIEKFHLEHPVLLGLVDAVQNENKQFFLREVEIGRAIFEQSVHYIAESRLIRSYLVDITDRKQAEKALKQLNEKLEIQVEKRTIELRQTIERLQAEISERQQAEAKIHYQAWHDLLTGLANRSLFTEMLGVSLARVRNSENLLAVIVINLDRFKTINDTLGHAIGDRVLQLFAERLTRCLRLSDTVARWGGDQFTMLLSHISSPEDASKISQRVLDTMTLPFKWDCQSTGKVIPPIHISTSMGIALYPQDGEDAETLLRNADAALHRAKENGRNNYRFYCPEMNSQAAELFKLENRLHQALERGELIIYYQPQVNIKTLAITGMEALLRWQHPELGLVPPGQFIPLAEETGLIVPIGEWVLKTACAQNRVWQEAGFSELRVAVNLSPRQFQQPNLVTCVARILSETGLAPEFLELEITESTVMQNVDFTRAMLGELQEMGVSISMDDFGTGYSSLSYLKKFPFHTLKIDRSFVRDLKDNPQDTAIISAVIALGCGLNLRVVAEGVENIEQLELLRRLECEQMQGYLFSRPLTAQDATQLLQEALSQESLLIY